MTPDEEIQPKSEKVDILIVEDDRAVSLLYEGVLMALGHRIVIAGSAEQAGARIEEKTRHEDPFELIILDVSLPGKSGLKFCQDIREVCPTSWIIAATSHRDPETVRAMLKAGTNDYLTKPVSPEEIILRTSVGIFAQARMRAFKKRIGMLEKIVLRATKT